MKKITIISMVLLLSASLSEAQEILTLDRCLDIALENNLQIKRSENNLLIAKSNKVQAIGNFLPSIQGSINYNYFFGTTFDQSAARQVTATTGSSNPNLSASWNIFSGFNNTYLLKRRNVELESARNSIESDKLNTRSSVYDSYLSIILDRENIKISDERIALLEQQLEREIQREKVGVSNMEMVFNFKSQLANEKLSNVNLQNLLKADKLALYQLLRLKASESFEVASFETDDAVLLEVVPFGEILAKSLEFSPAIKVAQLNKEATRLGFKQTVSSRYPTIGAFATIGSNFSTNGAVNPETNNFESDANFLTQLEYNQFELIGFRLNIPIFNNFSTSNNIQVAKLNYYNSELDVEQAYQTVTNTLQRTYLDLVAAQETYKSAKENLEALNQSFEFVKKRYEEGLTDFYTYLESLNNKNRAEIELANAKYSIVFRKKILDLLQGA